MKLTIFHPFFFFYVIIKYNIYLNCEIRNNEDVIKI